ncbi:cupredoxin domain-containing protein [Algicella marina]|uniref:Copper-binding protein n=1 Tax=Algicella marina TaxID=2683284 RepID=A0A6P1SWL9_9RHOB|nr:cupredoxin domain-containing protein [Algicella marina]QHQ33733.1 copper-binding protein [Algicella marina]
MRTIVSALALSLALSASAFAADHSVAIRGGKYVPAALTVASGDTITFTNEGPAPHTATANDGSFDTGRLVRGKSATVTVTGSGDIPYFCRVHPAMKAVVTAN